MGAESDTRTSGLMPPLPPASASHPATARKRHGEGGQGAAAGGRGAAGSPEEEDALGGGCRGVAELGRAEGGWGAYVVPPTTPPSAAAASWQGAGFFLVGIHRRPCRGLLFAPTAGGVCDGNSRPGHQTPGCFQITSCLSSGSLLFTVDALRASAASPGSRQGCCQARTGWGGKAGRARRGGGVPGAVPTLGRHHGGSPPALSPG